MAGKNTAAFGIYSTRVTVENAVDTLKVEDYRNTDISVLFLRNTGTGVCPRETYEGSGGRRR